MSQLIARMVGRAVENLFPPRTPAATRVKDVVLTVRDLSAQPALKHASFELRRGEILGIAGLMGSGRTELVRALFGLDAATGGEITIKGKRFDVGNAQPVARLRQGVGYVSEDRKGEGLSLPLSVADNLTATSLSSVATRWGWLDLERQYDRARHWIDALHIRARSPAERVRTLSGGNQQKVVIGRLLDQDADVLLLDEPTRGVDIGSKEQVYAVITQSAAEGKAVLMVSSYLPELFGVCDRLAVMRRGRLSAVRPIHEWTPESVLAAAIEDSTPAD
jgi:ribose transport system ATP-binding protein